ncbi:CATRA system-associated protein [Streptomyces sp. NPDC056242]|uniref:CATRA system-associated protein n=1 Tax=Streptomyces sp. NPDC056242 TaxID=3345760 RepID=UPI0035DA062D
MEEELRQTAAEVLADVEVWQLRAKNWDVVGQGLKAMQDALTAGDLAAFQQALADVELAGPQRISGLEDCSMLPLPEEHRERLDELVHALDSHNRASRAASGADAAGPDAPS